MTNILTYKKYKFNHEPSVIRNVIMKMNMILLLKLDKQNYNS